MPKEKYQCLTCNEEFLRYKTQQKSSLTFCSNHCRASYEPLKRKNRVEGFCSHCGQKYELIASRMRRSSYCSKACMYSSLRDNSWLGKINHERFLWLAEGVD